MTLYGEYITFVINPIMRMNIYVINIIQMIWKIPFITNYIGGQTERYDASTILLDGRYGTCTQWWSRSKLDCLFVCLHIDHFTPMVDVLKRYLFDTVRPNVYYLIQNLYIHTQNINHSTSSFALCLNVNHQSLVYYILLFIVLCKFSFYYYYFMNRLEPVNI